MFRNLSGIGPVYALGASNLWLHIQSSEVNRATWDKLARGLICDGIDDDNA